MSNLYKYVASRSDAQPLAAALPEAQAARREAARLAGQA